MPAYICVKDRQGNKKTKGILMDRCKWKELEDIVTKNERMAFKAEEHAKYLQQRKDLSAKIQSEMDNTYVNIRKKRFEEVEARRAIAEAEGEKKYWQLRREEQELRDQITRRARHVLSQEKDCNKRLNRALVLAETLRERKAQVDFNNALKQKELDKEIEYAKSIREDVEKFHQEEFENKSGNSKTKSRLKEEGLKMLLAEQEAKLKQQLDIKEEGRKELERLRKEIKEEEEKEKIEKMRLKARSIKFIEENIKMKEDYKKRMQLIDQEEEKKIRIIREAKKRLNDERKRREKESQAAAIMKRNRIAEIVAAEADDVTELENRAFAIAEAKKDALEIKRIKDDEEHLQKMKSERIQAYKDHLLDEEAKKQEEFEIRKWNMLQRFKKDEAIRKYENDINRRSYDATREYRIVWNQQIKERKAKEQREIEEDVDALNRANEVWRNEDREFLKYADEMIAECERVGRPVYPIVSVLKDYKKTIGLLPKSQLSATWKSNVPIHNPAVEEEAQRRQINRPQIRPKCSCIPRNGV